MKLFSPKLFLQFFLCESLLLSFGQAGNEKVFTDDFYNEVLNAHNEKRAKHLGTEPLKINPEVSRKIVIYRHL